MGVFRNGGGLGTGESYIAVVFFDPLLHRSPCFPDVDYISSDYIVRQTTIHFIIIIISVENCTNIKEKKIVIFYAYCCTNCYYNLNPCGIFEKVTLISFSEISAW